VEFKLVDKFVESHQKTMITVWMFTGDSSKLPSGIFSSKGKAEDWVRRHKLTGTLSEFPLDNGTYDHAIAEGLFEPRKEHETEAWFIADFSPRLPHEHWRNGDHE
jgi:hypothetical protein